MIVLTKTVVGAAAIALAASLAGAAFAGECPAEKRGTDVTKPGATASKEVSDVVLTSVDLAKEKVALSDHHLRLRKLDHEYTPDDRVKAVETVLKAHHAGEVLTGVFYVDTKKPDFLNLLGMTESPLATLPQDVVRPGKQALDTVMEELR